MAQIISDPYSSGNIVGALGRSFGQGIAEQLPKEMERGRLSQGLRQLASQDFTGKNPLERLSSIYSIPGMTPELAQQAERYLRGSSYFSNQANIGSGQNLTNISSQSVSPSTASSQVVAAKKPNIKEMLSSPISAEDISQYMQNKLQPVDDASIRIEAQRLYNQGIYQTPEEAVSDVSKRIETNRFVQQQNIDNLRKSLTLRLNNSLHGKGLGNFESLPGELQNYLLDRGEYLVNKGITSDAVAVETEKLGLDFAKAINSLKESGTRPFWQAAESLTDLRSQRKPFANHGFGEIFDNMAAGTLGVSRLEIAHELDPIQNKQIEKIFSEGPKMFQKEGKKMQQSRIAKIASYIKPRDNLLDIEYRLREQGLSIDNFRNEVLKLDNNKTINLTDDQRRQLNVPVSQSFLGDLLFETFKRFK